MSARNELRNENEKHYMDALAQEWAGWMGLIGRESGQRKVQSKYWYRVEETSSSTLV